jgi:hypothetical protein
MAFRSLIELSACSVNQIRTQKNRLHANGEMRTRVTQKGKHRPTRTSTDRACECSTLSGLMFFRIGNQGRCPGAGMFKAPSG